MLSHGCECNTRFIVRVFVCAISWVRMQYKVYCSSVCMCYLMGANAIQGLLFECLYVVSHGCECNTRFIVRVFVCAISWVRMQYKVYCSSVCMWYLMGANAIQGLLFECLYVLSHGCECNTRFIVRVFVCAISWVRVQYKVYCSSVCMCYLMGASAIQGLLFECLYVLSHGCECNTRFIVRVFVCAISWVRVQYKVYCSSVCMCYLMGASAIQGLLFECLYVLSHGCECNTRFIVRVFVCGISWVRVQYKVYCSSVCMCYLMGASAIQGLLFECLYVLSHGCECNTRFIVRVFVCGISWVRVKYKVYCSSVCMWYLMGASAIQGLLFKCFYVLSHGCECNARFIVRVFVCAISWVRVQYKVYCSSVCMCYLMGASAIQGLLFECLYVLSHGCECNTRFIVRVFVCAISWVRVQHKVYCSSVCMWYLMGASEIQGLLFECLYVVSHGCECNTRFIVQVFVCAISWVRVQCKVYCSSVCMCYLMGASAIQGLLFECLYVLSHGCECNTRFIVRVFVCAISWVRVQHKVYCSSVCMWYLMGASEIQGLLFECLYVVSHGCECNTRFIVQVFVCAISWVRVQYKVYCSSVCMCYLMGASATQGLLFECLYVVSHGCECNTRFIVRVFVCAISWVRVQYKVYCSSVCMWYLMGASAIQGLLFECLYVLSHGCECNTRFIVRVFVCAISWVRVQYKVYCSSVCMCYLMGASAMQGLLFECLYVLSHGCECNTRFIVRVFVCAISWVRVQYKVYCSSACMCYLMGASAIQSLLFECLYVLSHGCECNTRFIVRVFVFSIYLYEREGN